MTFTINYEIQTWFKHEFFYQSAIQYVAFLYLRKTKQDNMLLSITLKRTRWLHPRKPFSLTVILSRATSHTHWGAHVSIHCHQVSKHLQYNLCIKDHVTWWNAHIGGVCGIKQQRLPTWPMRTHFYHLTKRKLKNA